MFPIRSQARRAGTTLAETVWLPNAGTTHLPAPKGPVVGTTMHWADPPGLSEIAPLDHGLGCR
jgi:hypothetical protein